MISVCVFLGLLLVLLSNSRLAGSYVLEGLNVWATRALPALFPFMVLSGLIIRLELAERVSKAFKPILGRLYHASLAACYVMLVGFLCGFPMGARTIAELYERGRLTKRDGKWLLAFCNNLSPAYVMGVLFPMLGIKRMLPYLLGFYGLPLIYGWILRIISLKHKKVEELDRPINIAPRDSSKPQSAMPFGTALRESIESATHAVIILGGYLAFFCLLNLFPHLILQKAQPILGLLLEVTTGLNAMEGRRPILCLCAATFGGLSCIAQTHAALSHTDLTDAMGEYVIHKIILTAISVAWYYALFRFSGF